MAGNPFYQDFSPAPVPPPVTPADAPSSPENYAGVTPHGQGTAPYDIQTGNGEAAVASAFGAANAVAGAGVLYPRGPRQAQTETLLNSVQGYGEQDIDAGWSGGGGDTGWPANVEPPGM